MLLHIACGNRECSGRDIDGAHRNGWPVLGEADGQDARAGAQVEHAQRGIKRDAFERQFNQQLGIGPGNQHAGADFEAQAEEFALADQVGNRLAGRAACQQLAVLRGVGVIQFDFRLPACWA